MPDYRYLAELIRQSASGEGQESSLDKINKIFGTVGNVGNVIGSQADQYQEILKKKQEADKLKMEQGKLRQETSKIAGLNTPLRDTNPDTMLTRENATINETTTPEQRAKMEELFKRREAAGEMTFDQADTQSQIGLRDAQAKYYGSGQKGGRMLFVDLNPNSPTFRDSSEVEKPGYTAVPIATGATIATQPGREKSTADRQEASAIRAVQAKEASENRAKYKADLDLIQSVKDNLTASKDVLKNVTPGVLGAGESLLGKTGLGFSDAATYDRTKNALAVSLYRAITGDTRLSDADAATRALPLLPSTNQNEAQRDQLFKFVDDAIERRKQFLSQGIKEVPWANIQTQSPIGSQSTKTQDDLKVGGSFQGKKILKMERVK